MMSISIEKEYASKANNTELDDGSFFRCKSNDMISIIARCDNVIDCFDASDELDCRNKIGRSLFNCVVVITDQVKKA